MAETCAPARRRVGRRAFRRQPFSQRRANARATAGPPAMPEALYSSVAVDAAHSCARGMSDAHGHRQRGVRPAVRRMPTSGPPLVMRCLLKRAMLRKVGCNAAVRRMGSCARLHGTRPMHRCMRCHEIQDEGRKCRRGATQALRSNWRCDKGGPQLRRN